MCALFLNTFAVICYRGCMDKQSAASPMVLKYFLILFFISILLVAKILWPFLSILVLSYLLSAIFQPIYKFLTKKFSPSFSSLATCTLIILLVFVPLLFFIGALSQEAFSLYQFSKGANLGLKLREFLHENEKILRLQEFLETFGISFQPENISQTLAEIGKVVGFFIYNQASAWAANILSFIFNFFMLLIIIFFLLKDHEHLIDFLLRLSPLPDDQERQLIQKFEKIAGAVLIGNGICGMIQGVLGGLIFAFFNLGPPILWGVVMGILAFLPIFGIGLVLVPASVILIMKGNVGAGVFLIVFYMIISFSIEYLLKPKLVGTQVQMHTLLVFLAIMGGLAGFGVLGIIYGPLIVTAFLTLSDIYLSSYDHLVKEAVAEKLSQK